MSLTPRQSELLDTIHCLTLANKQPPTIREIAKAMGISSPNGVNIHLKALRKSGHIEKPSGGKKARGIRVVDQEFCPCCGQSIQS